MLKSIDTSSCRGEPRGGGEGCLSRACHIDQHPGAAQVRVEQPLLAAWTAAGAGGVEGCSRIVRDMPYYFSLDMNLNMNSVSLSDKAQSESRRPRKATGSASSSSVLSVDEAERLI